MRDVYSIGDAEAEVIEAQVLNTSPIAGQRIRDINFPEGVLIGGVLKNGEMVKPTGGLRIEDGDILAIFALAKTCLNWNGCFRFPSTFLIGAVVDMQSAFSNLPYS